MNCWGARAPDRGVTRLAGHFGKFFDADAKKGRWGARARRVPLELGREGGNVR